MIFTWLANRRYTFNVIAPRSIHELVKYSSVSCLIALLNYIIYFGLLLVAIMPSLSLVLSTCSTALLSYAIYRGIVYASDY